jgi:uncharacterized protein (DUF2384 family)
MSAVKSELNKGLLVLNSFQQAVKLLGMKKTESASILGLNPTTINRHKNSNNGLVVDSKEFELALQFIRVYRSLFAIAGGDHEFMQHWFNTTNKYLKSSPKSLVSSIVGLVEVNQYLDAMRGKV